MTSHSKSSKARPGSTPVYLAIQNALRDAIAKQRVAPGERLPSELELAKRYNTTRATVVHALQELVFEGLVEKRRGLGTFVATPAISTGIDDTHRPGYFEADLFARGQDVTYRVVHFGPVAVSVHVRGELKLGPNEPVHRIQRVRLVEKRPLAVEVRYVPSTIARMMDTDALAQLTLQDIFQKQLGMKIERIVNTVRVALVPQDLAKLLDLTRGRPVLVRAHAFLDQQGQAMLWGETAYREEYQIKYALTHNT
ncbi:GntR family transcriptional regulator [Chitinasiproducens palmae]|uniref:Transcriptional regulator, GntR family n=1 Tax=Chitinasiproducens palmae TaxID=1770053 RepID=A0A1H2PLQ5_9BURK|nr:GntR family transcriptional regulator [Chitinasiproducens palmae]SDV47015.1 transcriptional regulator, GntR family [Chitinasiproducens palmae]